MIGMKKWIKVFPEALLMVLLLLVISFSAAAENETVEVHIPVWASHTDCTAELKDEKGNSLHLLELKRAVVSEFVFECTGLLRHTFYIHLIDKDNREYRFDRTVYRIYVDVFMGEDGQPFYTVTVSIIGTLDPDDPRKQDAIRFHNHPKLPSVPFESLPETGFSASRLQEQITPALSYRDTGWTLQIPNLSLITDIVTVPEGEINYDVSGLGSRAGLLEGFDMPGEGITLITGHDHLSKTEAGPFAYLWEMEIGDRLFFLDPKNRIRIFEVCANEKVAEDDVAGLGNIMEDWEQTVTFITCEDERPEGGYANRRVVVARQIS